MKSQPKKIQSALIIYWVLLAYIIAALIFWFIELSRQNEAMSRYKLEELKKDDVNYSEKEKKSPITDMTASANPDCNIAMDENFCAKRHRSSDFIEAAVRYPYK